MTETTPVNSVYEPGRDVRQPFGLPLGTVRGFFAVLICGFFWLVMLWPVREGAPTVRADLGHFFLLSLVFMAFASHPSGTTGKKFLPWLMRIVFIGGSCAVVVLAWYRDPALLKLRLTPDAKEFAEWWLPYLGTMAVGFGSGLLARFVFGRDNHIFMTVRSWLSVVGMILLCTEYALFVGYASAETKPVDFFRYWQLAELMIVSAYFGTRA